MNAERKSHGALPGFGLALLWTLLALAAAHLVPFVLTDIGDSSHSSIYLTYTGVSPGVLLASSLELDPKSYGHGLGAVLVLGTAWSLTRNRFLGRLTLVVVGMGSIFTSLGLAHALLS